MARKNAIATEVTRKTVRSRTGVGASKLAPSKPRKKQGDPASPIFSPDLDSSDRALANVVKRLKVTSDPNEIRVLTDQLERIVFHKQFKNA